MLTLKTEADIAAYLEACAKEAPNDPVFMLKARISPTGIGVEFRHMYLEGELDPASDPAR